MKNLIITSATVALMTAVASPVSVFAHGGASGVVKQRMDAMGDMGSAVKALKEMMQGKVDFDADAVREQATIIKSHSGDALTKGFPEGSMDKPSEAKAEIWTDWDRFASLAGQLETLAEGLSLAADNGVQVGQGMGALMGNQSSMMSGKGMMGQMMGNGSGTMMGSNTMSPEDLAKMPVEGIFTMMVQTCSSCHTDFRAEKH